MLRTICAVAFSLMIGLLPVSAALACVAMPGQECPRLTPWLVFFDWNSDAIPPDRLTAINEVAIWWKAGSPRSGQKLTMSGYTDRSLPADQALELTERMAKHVADALVAAGVARDEIAVTWYGDEFGRVPTEPGIKEPQNRRVEMWFQFDPIPGVYLCDNLSIVDGQPKVSRIKTADLLCSTARFTSIAMGSKANILSPQVH